MSRTKACITIHQHESGAWEVLVGGVRHGDLLPTIGEALDEASGAASESAGPAHIEVKAA